ncbi:chemotaxis protein CheW [Muricoccus vinaceus]|uniref:Chemotaxis protein CheW n=1 Tax=Muricoccus vinaceus TaxID=424704 RepID=A0ABV6IP87_9PROT
MALRFLPDPGLLGQLDPARTARLMEERTRLLARRGGHSAAGAAPPVLPPVLLVALGAELYGLPLDRVAEVLPAEPPCALPGSPPEVLGLRARAGRLHALLDLAPLLGLPPGWEGARQGGHDVLLRPRPGARRLALRVDRALSAVSPLPLPQDAPPGGAVAFRATMPAAEAGAPILAVLDLDELLRSHAASPAGA